MPLSETKQIVHYFLLVTGITLVGAQGECPPTDDNKECLPSEFLWDQCVTDVDCDEGFRCCSDGCQLGCVEVKAVQTDEDTSESPEIKTGRCPVPFLRECEEFRPGKIFAARCLLDSQCNVGERCCSDGCNLVCMKAEIQEKHTRGSNQQNISSCTRTSTVEDPETRPGLCPAPSLDECEEKESAPDEKNPRECLIDQECDVGQKCCSDGCKLVCMALEIPKKESRGSNQQNINIHTRKSTAGVFGHYLQIRFQNYREDPGIRSGLCPPPSLNECEKKEVGSDERIPRECLRDQECEVGEKCCSDGCKLGCMAVGIPEKN